ncbi:Ribosomal protein S21 [Ceratocystis lukuohia]|uniref:Ribosomal protein S21 n=1 Tax=Ceratocystis lukuohia TaxID=2019550 RepID=A0ABR4MAG8_9PEZI
MMVTRPGARSFTISTLLRGPAPWRSIATAKPCPLASTTRIFSSTALRPDVTSDWVKSKIFGQSNPKPSAGNESTKTSGDSESGLVSPSQSPPQTPNPVIWGWKGGIDRSGLTSLLNTDQQISGLSNPLPKRPRYKQAVRLAPSTGRTVHLTSHTDASMALRILNTRVRQNGLPKLVRLQRAHERPGLKRKRLKSERWRARFRESFLSTVSRVQELTRQGW